MRYFNFKQVRQEFTYSPEWYADCPVYMRTLKRWEAGGLNKYENLGLRRLAWYIHLGYRVSRVLELVNAKCDTNLDSIDMPVWVTENKVSLKSIADLVCGEVDSALVVFIRSIPDTYQEDVLLMTRMPNVEKFKCLGLMGAYGELCAHCRRD